MNNLLLKAIVFSHLILLSISPAKSQDLNPDKFINYMKKDPSAFAITLPGWFVKLGGNIAGRDMEADESAFLKELTGHIKKLRFVVCEDLPEDFNNKFTLLKSHMTDKGYEPLIEVVDDGSKVHLWANFNGNTVKQIVISVLSEDDTSAFFNIKSNIDLDNLKSLDFYKDWESSM